MYIAVAILRVQGGLDYSRVVADEEDILNGINGNCAEKSFTGTRRNSQDSLPRNQSFPQISQGWWMDFFIDI